MYEKILLAVDPRGLAESVVPAVASVARRSGAEVLAVGVCGLEETDQQVAAVQALVDGAAAELSAAGVPARAEVRFTAAGSPAKEIIAAADEFGARLIAMGSRGRSDLGGLVLGSVSHQVAALCDIPILVTHAGTAPAEELETSYLTHPINRILVPFDGSPESLGSVEEAGRLALEHGAEVMVLHVLELLAAGEASYVETPDAGQEAAQLAVARLQAMGIAPRVQVIANRAGVAGSINEFAASWNPDLIVLGSRRHGDFGSLFLGSVTHQLLRLSQRPLLMAERSRAAAQV